MPARTLRRLALLSALIAVGWLLVWALTRVNESSILWDPGAVPPSTRPVESTATATSVWLALQQVTPVPFTTPLPEPIPGPLDGTYTKIDPSPPQWWACRRCADYRPAGGIWRLEFDRGVARIFYEVTGWRSLTSVNIAGDRLFLFNDPYCPEVVGEYRWELEHDTLRLTATNDTCEFGLRGKNLSQQAWAVCPANGGSPESASGSRSPAGCEDPKPAFGAAPTPSLPVAVAVRPGDSRFYDDPPDVRAYANTDDQPAPAGIDVAFHSGSIAYGLNRVIWWNGDWIEATTNLPFESMGVQILGEPQTGWARVLFDGVEVWRGNSAAIWSGNGRHGGYVEVSGYGPGRHTLRAESLGFDYRPVTVASFGFRHAQEDAAGEP